ncbi:luminal binding protein 5 [Tanacetum coccineum]
MDSWPFSVPFRYLNWKDGRVLWRPSLRLQLMAVNYFICDVVMSMNGIGGTKIVRVVAGQPITVAAMADAFATDIGCIYQGILASVVSLLEMEDKAVVWSDIEKWKKRSAAAVANRKKFQGVKKDRRDTGGYAQNVVETNTVSQSLGAESASQTHRTCAESASQRHRTNAGRGGSRDKCSSAACGSCLDRGVHAVIILMLAVIITDSQRLIGDDAKNQAALNAGKTIFDVKRLIGRKFEDKEVQRDLKLIPYKIVNKDGNPYIQVQKDDENKVCSPEEISAMILTKMKETAETYLGYKVKGAVVTVPASLNMAGQVTTLAAIPDVFGPVQIYLSNYGKSMYNLDVVMIKSPPPFLAI